MHVAFCESDQNRPSQVKEGGEQGASVSRPETFLLELLGDYKIKSEENHIPLPSKGLSQSKPITMPDRRNQAQSKMMQMLTPVTHCIKDFFKCHYV